MEKKMKVGGVETPRELHKYTVNSNSNVNTLSFFFYLAVLSVTCYHIIQHMGKKKMYRK